MVRSRTGRLVPASSLDAKFKKADELEKIWRKRALKTLAITAFLVSAFMILLLSQTQRTKPKIESVLRDSGYVIVERKGVGMKSRWDW